VGPEECAELESDPAAVACARRFVRDVLSDWRLDHLVDDVLVLTSELVTNAVLHARTGIKVTVSRSDPAVLRVSVFDENLRLPTLAGAPEEATSGRGLHLVEALADAWGIEQRPDGKIVWAEVGRPPESPDDCIDLTT
jgi:anti-sigma regulatory factor (Ser/Thr protein kinase)